MINIVEGQEEGQTDRHPLWYHIQYVLYLRIENVIYSIEDQKNQDLQDHACNMKLNWTPMLHIVLYHYSIFYKMLCVKKYF